MTKGKISKGKKIPKAKKKVADDGIISLDGISATQIILAHYAYGSTRKRKPVVINQEDTDSLPQTIIDNDEIDILRSDLMHEKSRRSYYFLDVRKNQIKLWPNMIDVVSNGALPTTTIKSCWWCRHTFTTRPIGCPIRYHPHKSHGVERQRVEEKFKNADIPLTDTDFFETEGYFCSFPCCKAYIIDKGFNAKYKESISSLSLLFKILYGKLIDIPVAPSWKILKEYGGHLTIQEYRSTFGRLEYEETINIRRPYMFASSQYISEKKIKLFRGVKE